MQLNKNLQKLKNGLVFMWFPFLSTDYEELIKQKREHAYISVRNLNILQ